ncbi:ferritin-like domain-containing protein [Nannocystis punicea]|uniref:Ferritin-like domain-containing protein n=1 Tax=Nannocystis punicea TaxID=2995304 RepID=A0ABY7H6C8_9BACT|nr:ferritin-like domain-containing protein [Nannocystis poenicansa]WAS94667.1 ferritin-like domain-containing protein [Nannocystis poenicansa]
MGTCQGAQYAPKVELTPEEYAEFQRNNPFYPDDGSHPTTSAGESTTDASTGTTDGDASTTDASTDTTDGDASTDTTDGDESTTGGELLSEAETCELVCQYMVDEYEKPQACEVTKAANKVIVECAYPATCGGRRHACVTSWGERAEADPAGAWLARAAHDEAASVHAFHELARELAAWGAPAELLARIDAAAADEVRHAEVVANAARVRGAEVTPPTHVALAVRELQAIAVENAVEGCVRETWAALAAAHQARFAAEPELRAMYAEIAADEARHAELAWAIDAWLMGQLDAAGREAVATARRAAIAELLASLAGFEEPALHTLGLPPAVAAVRLCGELDAALWSRAA